jgi:hypothetical protein
VGDSTGAVVLGLATGNAVGAIVTIGESVGLPSQNFISQVTWSFQLQKL